MRWFSLLVPVIVLAACLGALAQTPTYNLGRTPSAEEIQAWDIAIGPSGKELPLGSGTVVEGEKIYAMKCIVCHGPTGREGPDSPGIAEEASRLVGGQGTLNTRRPVRTIGSFWPFATTLWDYINRAMPAGQEGSLRADEVYALTAFLLYRNDIIKVSEVIDAKSLPKVHMPNRNGFIPAWPEWEKIRKPPGPFGIYP